jgi:hypothetical protein
MLISRTFLRMLSLALIMASVSSNNHAAGKRFFGKFDYALLTGTMCTGGVVGATVATYSPDIIQATTDNIRYATIAAKPRIRYATLTAPFRIASLPLDQVDPAVSSFVEADCSLNGIPVRTTLLGLACWRDSYEFCKFLLEHGANPNATCLIIPSRGSSYNPESFLAERKYCYPRIKLWAEDAFVEHQMKQRPAAEEAKKKQIFPTTELH